MIHFLGRSVHCFLPPRGGDWSTSISETSKRLLNRGIDAPAREGASVREEAGTLQNVKLLRLIFPITTAFAGGIFVGATIIPRAQATPENQNPYQSVNQFGRVLVQIENHYV